MKHIISFGECLSDRISSAYIPGGAPLNFAIACQQISDCGVAIISAVGHDHLGNKLVDLVNMRGVENQISRVFDAPTGIVEITEQSGATENTIREDVAYDKIPVAGYSLQAAHHLASEVSSYVATQRGGQPMIPERYHVASLGKMDMLNL